MKKTLIAIAVLGATGIAHAQSNMTIYGTVDAGYAKSTGSKATMGEKYDNRLGFMGTEDLGNGLKATFQLEQRFHLFDGSSANSKTFEGASNVGLKGSFGQVRFGRVDELSTETFRKIDPFEQYGVGSMFKTHLRGDNLEGRISNTVRYDSPNLKGFQLGASYTIKNGSKSYLNALMDGMGIPEAEQDYLTDLESAGNHGYAVSASYANGSLYLVSNYNVAANTNKSYNWNVGGAYTVGPARISVGYEQTKDKLALESLKWDTWLLGLNYKVGAGAINASYSQRRISGDSSTATKDKKLALGYSHNLSKRTSVYFEAAQTRYDGEVGIITDYLGNFPRAMEMLFSGRDQVTAISIGMTHKF